MNVVRSQTMPHGFLGKFSYYGLPLLFLLSCSSPKPTQKYGLFAEDDFIESHSDYFDDEGVVDYYDFSDEFGDCILLQRDNADQKMRYKKKSIAYPERDIHELYPYVEEISLETDSLKNK